MLKLENISCQFDNQIILQDVDLQIEDGEIVCLLGASGSGKTTLLRIVAGLQDAYSGKVFFKDQLINGVPVHKRGFGLMFQDFALFPHLNVADNIAFGLKMKGWTKTEKQQRVDEMLSLVGLEGFADRDVTALSGGERQRVALARSLAPKPRLLMLDEPLGSLDASLRERLAIELREIIKAIGLTAIYVTHDQQEAFAIADRIAILHQGNIEQADTPQNLYLTPQTVFSAQFLGFHNIISVSEHKGFVQSVLPNCQSDYIFIHPDAITIQSSSSNNCITGIINQCIFQGKYYQLNLEVTDTLTLQIYYPTFNHQTPQLNDKLFIQISPSGILELEA